MNPTPLLSFLLNNAWDAPFFKILAHNDTSEAKGNQGGPAIPKAIRRYLPELSRHATSATTPTTERRLLAEMYLGLNHVADDFVRYQIQTWHGTRSPEGRITKGFAPLWKLSTSGDILVMQRRALALDRFRLVLIKKGSPEYEEVAQLVSGRRPGKLIEELEPVSEDQLTDARVEVEKLSSKPFELIKTEVKRVEARQKRIARSIVFRETVREEYRCTCAITGIALTTPKALFEVESAHIVPISEGGSDDVRNGFTLSQTIHWAFDRGLIGVTPERTIYVPKQVKSLKQNSFLCQFSGRRIIEAKNNSMRVHGDAIAWHFKNRVSQWD